MGNFRKHRDPSIMADFDLIIFDCDGVLVDSEPLANGVLAQAVSKLGIQMDTGEAIRIFRGRAMADCITEIENRLGARVPETFILDYRWREREAFELGLRAVEGVSSVLENLPFARCVASNAPSDKIHRSLGITGLLRYFVDRIFSAYDVGHWKPDPRLFLHAASALQVAPQHCVVVEDSLSGVQAAVAAGMRVFGYAPHDEDEHQLAAAGATTFRAMGDLKKLLTGGS
jgi:HAD superfamily hydrolase (TIGR01509 family)